MASCVENQLCSSCLDSFNDPVLLPCSHSFCRACVRQWWQENRDQTCPTCWTEFKWMAVPSNLPPRNVCEACQKASVKSEDICGLHKEKLALFCLDHQELVCLVCIDTKVHTGHRFSSLNEVGKDDRREKLREGLQVAKERLSEYNEARDDCNEQAMHIKFQRERLESKIKKDFQELHRFLLLEEEDRLSAVRDEEQKKTWMTEVKLEALDRDVAPLSDLIGSTEELLTSEPIFFKEKVRTAMIRIQKLPKKPELLKGALLDEAKHVGNLKFSVWERMKEVVPYSPVVLDPKTAGPALSLSEDLTSVTFQDGQQRPKNPERFKWNHVLGSALSSGIHAWDVSVGDNTHWGLGVAWGDACLPNDMKTFRITFCDDKYQKFNNPLGSWKPPVKLRRIRVQVDMNKRSVSFSESLTNTQLCKTKRSAWPRLSDSMKMFPYFWTADQSPLQVIPRACSVFEGFAPTILINHFV